jgi:hypothetical protein
VNHDGYCRSPWCLVVHAAAVLLIVLGVNVAAEVEPEVENAWTTWGARA